MSLLDKAMGAKKKEYIPDLNNMSPALEIDKLSHFVEKVRKGLEGRFAWEKHAHHKSHDYIGTGKFPRDDIPITIRGKPPLFIPVIQKGKRNQIVRYLKS